jgi:hypothetical protein
MKKFKGDKCPTCGTEFIESLHPFDVAVRKQFARRRAAAAKKGWRTRRAKAKA